MYGSKVKYLCNMNTSGTGININIISLGKEYLQQDHRSYTIVSIEKRLYKTSSNVFNVS